MDLTKEKEEHNSKGAYRTNEGHRTQACEMELSEPVGLKTEFNESGQSVKSSKRRPRPASAEIAVSPLAKADSRYGRKLGDNRYFSKEPRWSSKEGEVGAPQYLLKPLRSEQESAFGTSTREDWGRIMGLIPKTNPNAGPGAYRIVETMVLSSEMPRQRTVKFPVAERPSMELGTLSPGPIYDLEGRFKSGRDFPSKIMPGFNLDKRKPMVTAATEAMYDPPLPKGLSCTIKQRRTPSKLKAEQDATAPAPHDYDVVKALAKLNKEPCYSFGKGAARFKEMDRISAMVKQLEETEKLAAKMRMDMSNSTK